MQFIAARTLVATVFVITVALSLNADTTLFSAGVSACDEESAAPSRQCQRRDEPTDATRGDHAHVRVEDKKLRTLVQRGALGSPTLRALFDRLETSDVVAFVRYDLHLNARSAGALTFVSSVAGIRYVLIRVGYVGVAANQLGLVGHELRHAVEVADMQRIVDVPSLHREYARVGFLNPAAAGEGSLAYETHDAMRAGEQIARELRTGT